MKKRTRSTGKSKSKESTPSSRLPSTTEEKNSKRPSVYKSEDGQILFGARGDELRRQLATLTGLDDFEAAMGVMEDFLSLQPLPHDPDQINEALALVQHLNPRDQLECMLIVQMLAVHKMIIEYSKTLSISGAVLVDNGVVVRQVTRLVRTFNAQVETLGRYRGKGQQTVTVEHINIHGGSQAVVGSVHSSQGGGHGKSSG